MKVSISSTIFISLALTFAWNLSAQSELLSRQLTESQWLQYPMKADSADAGMTRWLEKKVEKTRKLPLASDFNSLKINGPGTIQKNQKRTISGEGSILLQSPTSLGTKDDIEGKARNHPADNFIAASFCARAAPFYKEIDPVFSRWCRQSAIADFRFANDLLGQFASDRNETELYAQAVVSAMHLYRLTHEKYYLDRAVQYAHVIMDAQQMERRTDWTLPLHGFFYESTQKKRILEYFHRSNEELMVQGLAMLLENAPDHPDAPLWRASCTAYAEYLEEISTVMEP